MAAVSDKMWIKMAAIIANMRIFNDFWPESLFLDPKLLPFLANMFRSVSGEEKNKLKLIEKSEELYQLSENTPVEKTELPVSIELENTLNRLEKHPDFDKSEQPEETEPSEETKRYSCIYCSYSTNQRHHLRDHMRTHTGVKPYACTICDYKCVQAQGLRSHMATHTGIKSYKCDQCDYTTAYPGSLKRHERVHTGEKPYVCGVCGHACNDQGNLKKHMRKNHPWEDIPVV